MPLHQIFHPEGLYTAEEKASLSAAITAVYQFPAFFVNVVFIPVAEGNLFVGGKIRNDFVRIVVDHVARNMNNEIERMEYFMERYEKAIAPYVKGGSSQAGKKVGGYEIHIDETPRELWRIDGLRPPMRDGEEEALAVWRKGGKAVAF